MSGPLDLLVVSQFFPPEMGAPAQRFLDFGSMLVERGHRVTVVTGFPNSPTGVVPEPYRRRLAQREEIHGVQVLRGWLYASPRLTSFTKSAGFASFAASASLQVLLRGLRADVVVATSPPPTVGVPGLLAAARLRAPLVFDVRDIWPEAIAASGRLQSGPLVRALEGLERAIYRRSSAVTVVTGGKRERLVEKGVPPGKIRVIPNGVDLARFLDAEPAPPALLRELGLDPARFLIVYAGVMNPPQGLDVLLDAAHALAAASPETASKALFALIGGGSEQERLAARVRDEGLGDRVRIVPVQPRERIPSLLKAAGAVAIPLRPRRDTHTVPSKLYEAMASARPVLCSADGAPFDIVQEAKAGIATRAGDAEALSRAILALANDPALAESLGKRGIACAAGFDRRRLVDELEALLFELAGAR